MSSDNFHQMLYIDYSFEDRPSIKLSNDSFIYF